MPVLARTTTNVDTAQVARWRPQATSTTTPTTPSTRPDLSLPLSHPAHAEKNPPQEKSALTQIGDSPLPAQGGRFERRFSARTGRENNVRSAGRQANDGRREGGEGGGQGADGRQAFM